MKHSNINSEEFGYVTYKFFVFYISSDMTQACLKSQAIVILYHTDIIPFSRSFWWSSSFVFAGEVEEQLIELVPEWISEKLASGGDLLFRWALLICYKVVDGFILIVIENKWIFKNLSLEDHKLFFKRQNLYKLFDVIICSFLQYK